MSSREDIGQIRIGTHKQGAARMRCRNHGMMPCLHIGCSSPASFRALPGHML
jgi:hypothetical protein